MTYAIPDEARTDEVNGKGHGFVDIFSPTGALLTHFAGGGQLDSPWGVALAPANFGPLSNLFLIGNFGDGRINAYDPTGKFVSTLNGKNGKPIVNPGLWALNFGDGTTTRPITELLFTAGSPSCALVRPTMPHAPFLCSALSTSMILSRSKNDLLRLFRMGSR